MAIEIVEEPCLDLREREHCCFCFRTTVYWHAPKDVAVCPTCAEVHDESEVPSKKDWCASVVAKFPHIRG